MTKVRISTATHSADVTLRRGKHKGEKLQSIVSRPRCLREARREGVGGNVFLEFLISSRRSPLRSRNKRGIGSQRREKREANYAGRIRGVLRRRVANDDIKKSSP